MERRPPLDISQRRLRRRWEDPLPPPLPKSTSTRRLTTPSAAKSPRLPSTTQAKLMIRPWPSASDELTPRSTPDYQLIGGDQSSSVSAPQSLYERGKFYDVYSALREERLKRKKVEASEVSAAVAPDTATAVQLTKRRNFKKEATEAEAAEFSANRRSTLPRGCKEIIRPVTARAAASGSSGAATGRKTSTSYLRKV